MLDRFASTPLAAHGADYALVRKAIRFISEESRVQPGIEDIADAVSLTPAELTALFRRWAGLTPKAFLQAVTLDHARRLLDEGLPLLDAALEAGLSGPSRLHDLFVTHEAISPGEYKSGGEGLLIRYGFHASPFGLALVMATERGLCGLAFADEGAPDLSGLDLAAPQAAKSLAPEIGRMAAFNDMQSRWPKARFVEDSAFTFPLAERAFRSDLWSPGQPLKVFLIGTDFEVRVWETLLDIPMGRATTYGTIASKLEKPGAARAVGAAVGRNPVSFVVPCHRVVGKSGALTGYHWGLTRKRAMLGWEAGRTAD
ncbi:MAG: methylated-DNA--[protein]-cysteine S-methyltransferase [Beijerinckiaceae bacterium]|jgi:AraC family transcriptional regulator of adaptative response/methylated-DNA-[protein]-cysteine methyltransferase|nr:methylated-DNA--[protein]-cysteine S-methyltransferase [Beijerinckiaceae bacterium]